MSAADRLQALEQLVTVMQSVVLLALTTAAQAEQHATDAETRSLTVRDEDVMDSSSSRSSATLELLTWLNRP